MRWPLGIGIGLAIVVLVDGVFIWVASNNAPHVESSYIEAKR